VTAFLSTASKAAGFAVAGRVFVTALPAFAPSWTFFLTVIAIMTMTLGNLVALKQTSVKRMLAYSSIAQAGYIVMGLAAINTSVPFDGVSGLLIYMFAYLFTNVGAFLVVAAIEKQTGAVDYPAFGGLIRRAPGLALMMTIFMLSLAGIPPTGGFLGKFFVFGAAINQQLLVLAAVAAVNAVIAAFYYLNVVRYMFFVEAGDAGRVQVSPGLQTVLVVSTVMVLLIGLVAQPFITWATQSVTMVLAMGY
ncbi:MAG: proton-conducting transporter membrane subunit, partial [Anaerolineae bacterium]|nr:NADH-quinone oxidoreductase subunit N [Caldilineales bacterium]MDW8270083.1 proton-conducting transporter membrane subunit [Anaerolineae bacterium]